MSGATAFCPRKQARASNLECRRSHNESICRIFTSTKLPVKMSNNTSRGILSSNDEKRHWLRTATFTSEKCAYSRYRTRRYRGERTVKSSEPLTNQSRPNIGRRTPSRTPSRFSSSAHGLLYVTASGRQGETFESSGVTPIWKLNKIKTKIKSLKSNISIFSGRNSAKFEKILQIFAKCMKLKFKE